MTDTGLPRESLDRFVEELVVRMNLGQSFDDLFQIVFDGLHGIVPYHRLAVAVLDDSQEKLRLVACRSDGPLSLKLGYTAPLAGSTLRPLLEAGQPRILNDLIAYLEAKPESTSTSLIVREGMRSNLTLPLVARGRPFGVVFFSSRDAHVYTPAHARLLGNLAGHLAIAMERAQLIETLEKKNRQLVEASKTRSRLEAENRSLREEVGGELDRELIGHSPAMQKVREAIDQVAGTDSTVLLLGETGTGKEVVARAIHQQSARRDELLVAVHCASLATGVLASELFGHEEGAFTGATRRRIGRFELARGGTIFLDEVGELTPEVQVHLLRVLQERILERVGGNEPIPVDVRVLAATNRDLSEAKNDGRFREDLYYRLNVFPIEVPPLRDRREDIPELIDHFLAKCRRRMNKPIEGVSEQTLVLAGRYSWPGNVRELENLVERAAIICQGDTLDLDPAWLPLDVVVPPRSGPALPLAERERRSILDALKRCEGKVYGDNGAAALLGLKPTTLYGKMKKHGITKQSSHS